MEQFAREGVDRLEPPPDPARPPLLHGPEARSATSARWSRFVRESELEE